MASLGRIRHMHLSCVDYLQLLGQLLHLYVQGLKVLSNITHFPSYKRLRNEVVNKGRLSCNLFHLWIQDCQFNI